MKQVALIVCGKRKDVAPQKAVALYQGELFRRSLAYALSRGVSQVYVLSALHGLLPADAVVAPYNLSLSDLSAPERRRWASRVLQALERVEHISRTHFIILAGRNYRDHLVKRLSSYEVPLEGLGIGEQLQWLGKARASE